MGIYLARCSHSLRERAVTCAFGKDWKSSSIPGPGPVKKGTDQHMDQKQVIKQMDEMLLVRYGCSMTTASPQQMYRALCYVVNGMLASKSAEFHRKNQDGIWREN